MLRRAFLSVLAALPSVSVAGRLGGFSDAASPAAADVEQEGDMWFWYYVYAAVQKDRVMSTERSRKHAVGEMELTALSKAEARRILKRANAGEYTIGDMPDQWQRVFDSIDRVEFR